MLLLLPSCQKCRLTFEDIFLSMLSIVTRSMNTHEDTGDLEDGSRPFVMENGRHELFLIATRWRGVMAVRGQICA